MLLNHGSVKCWGGNTVGQLGYGDTNRRDNTTNLQNIFENVSMISAGFYHTCAVMTDGNVKCWGQNEGANLGMIIKKI